MLRKSIAWRDAMHGMSLKDARLHECDVHMTNLWRLRDAEALDHTAQAVNDYDVNHATSPWKGLQKLLPVAGETMVCNGGLKHRCSVPPLNKSISPPPPLMAWHLRQRTARREFFPLQRNDGRVSQSRKGLRS